MTWLVTGGAGYIDAHVVKAFGAQGIGVVHLAGFKYAGVSVQRPLHTYDQNVTGTVSLLRACRSRP